MEISTLLNLHSGGSFVGDGKVFQNSSDTEKNTSRKKNSNRNFTLVSSVQNRGLAA